MADGVSVGSMFIELGLDPKAMRSAIAQLSAQFQPLTRAASSAGAKIAAVLGVGSAAGIVYMVKQTYDAVEAQMKLADQLDTTYNAIQAIKKVADDEGVAFEGVAKALGIMNVRLAEAARTGKGPAYDALNRLGISAKSFLALPFDERLTVLAKAMERLGYTAEQKAAAMRDLGARSQDMLTIMAGGGAKIEEMRKALEKFGLNLSQVDARKIVSAGQFFDDLAKAIDGVRLQLASALSPLIAYVAKQFSDWVQEQGGFRSAMQSWVEYGIMGIGRIVDVTRELISRWDELKEKGSAILTMSQGLATFAFAPMQALKKLATGLNEWDAATEKSKAAAAKPPSYTPWLEEFRKFREQFDKEQADAEQKAAEARANRKPPPLTGLSGEEAKAQAEKLAALKLSLANEAQAVDLHHQENLKKLAEFRKEGIATQAQYNELERMAMEDFRKKQREWQWSSYGEAIATEQEQLAHRYALIQEKLNEGIAAQRITEEEGSRARIALYEKEGIERAQLMANQWGAAAGVVSNALSQISGLMEDEGEKGFTIMKGLAMAAAAVQQMGAIVAAFKAGMELGGPATATVFAGIATAATAAMLAKMAGMGPKSKGGATGATAGGGGKSGGGSQQAAAAAGPQQSMVVSGFNPNEWVRGDVVRNMAKELVKFQNNGGKVFIT